MRNTPLQFLMIGAMTVSAMTLSACDNSKQDTVEEVTSDVSSNASEPKDMPNQEVNVPESDLDGATAAKGTPVSYDLLAWGQKTAEPIEITDLEAIQATFGKVISTDENSLDYASNPATKYRFMQTDEPYLDIVDSQKYLELGWYFANPTDTEEEKELSKSHAQKAHTLARKLMGEDGSQVLRDMLGGQIIKNQTVGGQKIELAKCEFYSCMLVLNKQSAVTK